MKIKSIKWGARMEDINFNVERTGSQHITNEAVVCDFGVDRVYKIEEITPTIYDTHRMRNQTRSILRVFNPTEVLFQD